MPCKNHSKKRKSLIKKVAKELLRGGLADNESSAKYNEEELRKGIGVEMEHTNDPAKAKEIAKDHLEEIPDYYTRLARMEHEAKMSKIASKDMESVIENSAETIGSAITAAVPTSIFSKAVAQGLGKSVNLMDKKPLSFLEHALGGPGAARKDMQGIMNAMQDTVIYSGPPGNGLMLDGAQVKKIETLGVDKKTIKDIIDKSKKLIIAPGQSGNIDILAHELGHGKYFRKGFLSKINKLPIRSVGSTIGLLMGASGNETAQEYAPYVAGASQVPLLAEEGRASITGIRNLNRLAKEKRVADSIRRPAIRKAIQRLGVAFGSYGALAAGATIAPIVASKFREYINRPNDAAAMSKTSSKDMPDFTDQDRPKKVKEIYKALKREHPNMPAGKKARIAESKGREKSAEKIERRTSHDKRYLDFLRNSLRQDLNEFGGQEDAIDINLSHVMKHRALDALDETLTPKERVESKRRKSIIDAIGQLGMLSGGTLGALAGKRLSGIKGALIGGFGGGVAGAMGGILASTPWMGGKSLDKYIELSEDPEFRRKAMRVIDKELSDYRSKIKKTASKLKQIEPKDLEVEMSVEADLDDLLTGMGAFALGASLGSRLGRGSLSQLGGALTGGTLASSATRRLLHELEKRSSKDVPEEKDQKGPSHGRAALVGGGAAGAYGAMTDPLGAKGSKDRAQLARELRKNRAQFRGVDRKTFNKIYNTFKKYKKPIRGTSFGLLGAAGAYGASRLLRGGKEKSAASNQDLHALDFLPDVQGVVTAYRGEDPRYLNTMKATAIFSGLLGGLTAPVGANRLVHAAGNAAVGGLVGAPVMHTIGRGIGTIAKDVLKGSEKKAQAKNLIKQMIKRDKPGGERVSKEDAKKLIRHMRN